MNKIWSIRGRQGKYSDEELINMIKTHQLSGDDYITNSEMKTWIKIKATIYQFYLGVNNNETI